MSDYSIWLLEYGYVDRFPCSNLFAAQPNEGHRRMPYCFGLVRDAQHCILVDTGFWDEPTHRRLTDKYGVTNWTPPAEVVARAGVRPSEVDTILLTHSHFDHAGCVADFVNAHVYIQQREISSLQEAERLPPRFGFLLASCQRDLPDALAKRAEAGLATLVPGTAEVFEGIRLRPAHDTHTAGSQFIVVDNDSDGTWLFAGDNVYQYENLEGLRDDGVMVPIAMSTGSATTWLHTADEVVGLVGGDTRRILPFHESRVWEQFPSREFDDGLHLAEVSLAGGHSTLLG